MTRIFIGGPQRSGTSLLRSILGSHSSIAFFPYDLKLWTKYRAIWQGQDFSKEDTVATLISQILEDEKVVIAEDVPSLSQVLAVAKEGDVSELVTDRVFDAFLRAYAHQRGKAIYGLKTPWNEFHADEILSAFDDAIFIHVIRDPRKCALSAMFVDGGSWFYDPSLHVSRWKKSAQLALHQGAKHGSRYLVVKYEELATDPQKVLTALLPQLGFAYEEGMEKGDKQPGWEGTNTSFDSQRPSGASRKPTLPPDLRHFYESRLRKEMEALGYSVNPDPSVLRALWAPVLALRLLSVFVLHRGIHLKSTVSKMFSKKQDS